MGIYKYQNSHIKKWRVSRKVSGVETVAYFSRTRQGRKDAEEYDQELAAQQLATRTALGGSTHYVENWNKGFKTGVCGVSLIATCRAESPSFQLMALHKGNPYSRSRSILCHGYESAWEQVVEMLWKLNKCKDPKPPPPDKKLALKYLRSIGVPVENRQF